MSVVFSNAICPSCGAARDAADAEGLCAACLLGDAMIPEGVSKALGIIGGHELTQVIARGGMGIVYRARQRDPAREVALKALPGGELLSEAARRRFRIEAEAMARLNHPGIVPVYKLGEEDGTPFFTMKLAGGGSLAERMSTFSGDWRRIAALMADIADAVQYAHEHGVLHRDLKPSNILFDEDGRTLVSDFGLAKFIGSGSDLTHTLEILGTPHYLAPELTHGGKAAATTACDVWSLGVILYEMMAGAPPFGGNNPAAVLRQLNEEEPPPLPGEIPRDLQVIARKALQKAAADRYESARDLAEELRRWLRGEPIHARPTTALESVVLWSRRRPALAALSVLLAVVVCVAGVLLWRSNTKLTAALKTSDAHLRGALQSEAGALIQSQELTARSRVLEIVRELSRLGEDAVEVRSLAVRGLTMTGLTPVRSLATRRANRASKMAFSADFTRYATGSVDGRGGFSVRAMDGGTKPLEFGDATGAEGSSFLFSPDGRRLALKTKARQMGVVDLQNTDATPFVPAGQHSTVSWPVAAFAPDGSHWVYGNGDEHVRLHRVEADGADEVIFTAPAEVIGMSYSPDGTLLAVQWRSGWGVVDAATREKFWQRDEKIAAIAPVWQPDGAAVGAGLGDPTRVVLAEARSGRSLHALLGHRGTISQFAFSPDGALLFTAGWDGQLILWDVATDLPVGRHTLAPQGFGISPDGRRIAFASEWDNVQVFELARPAVWRSWATPKLDHAQVYQIDLSADGQHLLNVTPSWTVLWNAVDGSYRGRLRHATHNSIRACFFVLPGMLWVERANRRGQIFFLPQPGDSADGVIEYRQLPGTGIPLARTADNDHVVIQEPDGRHLARGSKGPLSLTFPTIAGAEVADLSPDHTLAAYVSRDTMRVVRVSDGQVLFSSPDGDQKAVRFLPDGSHLIGCTKATTRVWETRSWKEVASWPSTFLDGYPSVACSRDGKHLATVVNEGVIEVRDAKSWLPLIRLAAPGASADHSGRTHLVWSADSKRIIVVVHGPRVYEWDVEALRRELRGLGADW